MKLKILVLTALFILPSANLLASGDHAHGAGDDHGDGHSEKHADDGHGHDASGKKFLKKKTIDGYDVSFHVMNAKDGMKMGDESHHLMIKVEKNGQKLSDIKVNSKVVHPNGKAQSKMLMKMGDWYMAGYDLGHKGKHQLMILFKTADGKKHSGGVYFSE